MIILSMCCALWWMMTNLKVGQCTSQEIKIAQCIKTVNKRANIGKQYKKPYEPEPASDANLGMTNLFCDECQITMINHFISLTKDGIERLPCSLIGIVHRNCPRSWRTQERICITL